MENPTNAGTDQVLETNEPRFCVVPRTDRGISILRLSGDLDLTTVPLLMEAVNAAVHAEGRQRIVFDCTGLAFCDSSGLNFFLQLHKDADRTDGFVLAHVGTSFQGLLDLTGADQALTVTPDVDAALARLGPETI
ncbi:STAS domain-containing protein [Streptomyces sp. NPDC058657]|uniref:STAS domain-containing protein n=1 Tax=unclassified Streptomyces TaxID=2593676 RepID=UPI0036548EB8